MKYRLYLSAAVACLATVTAQAIELGMVDDFETDGATCSLDNWFEGGASPNPPTAEAGCGVGIDGGSCCLSATSSGGGGPGSRQAVLNEDQWVGDYNDAGVTSIEMLAASAGMTDVFLRVGITNGITCYVSTNAVLLPADIPGPEGLFPAIFPLNEISMTQVFGNNCGGGGDSLETVLSGVIQMRLFSAENVSWLGDVVVSEMQVDIISALGNAVVDSDGDGVADDIDNCTLVENADQRDTDLDGFGNICDADLNNDCVANVVDLGLLRTVFFTGDPDADFNGDGVVNVIDLGILRTLFFQAPGPGQGICIPVEG